MFDAIAPRYDFLNRLLSGNTDRAWRRHAVRALDLDPSSVALDLATGTGDLALLAAISTGARVVGVDLAPAMLARARAKARARRVPGVRFVLGEAADLPLRDGSVNAAVIGFGIRNVVEVRRALGEIRRVLRPGGTLVVLEFAKPAPGLFRTVFHFYFRHILPGLGNAISRTPGAYTYLRDSVARFPEGEEFLALLREAGFERTRREPLTFGVAALYLGRTPPAPGGGAPVGSGRGPG
jgi:demethylmenaquinone methyltransferase/2-methoxy-6-polyprenyl-1,4-benzoquinol methylase